MPSWISLFCRRRGRGGGGWGPAEAKVGVVHKDGPILAADRVGAGAHVEREGGVGEGVEGRDLLDGEALRAEEAVDGIGPLEDPELAGGVGAGVPDGVAEQEGPGGDQGRQAILVEGELLRLGAELRE